LGSETSTLARTVYCQVIGETPDSLLHIAAARGQTDEIRRLVGRGVPVDLRSRTGQTPFHWASAAGRAAAAALLLELGADPNASDPARNR
jgi:ankyrin repeat protein